MQKSSIETGNDLRKMIEYLSDQIVRFRAQEEKVLSEFSAMNNEMVTLQRQLAKSNAELKEARLEAERANEAKSSLLAMISHEIRTPMTGIMGMAELMDGPDLPAKHRESVKVIHESSALLLNMINDLLDMSKIDAGKMDLKLEPVGIHHMINHISKLLDSKIKDNGNRLFAHVDDRIDRHLIGDSARINQVVLNLLNNANKFTSGGQLNIRVLLLEDSSQYQLLRFEIEDNGIGISSEDQKKLFQPYVQTDEGSSSQYGGTGLGLSICKSFIELMEGVIGLDSEEGQGSCFWFEIKLHKGDVHSIGTSMRTANHRTGQGTGTLNGQCLHLEAPVLIAEDNPINRQVLLMQLRRLGIDNVDVAFNGEEAVLAAQQKQYSLIFMDNIMPKQSGLEAAATIRRLEQEQGCSPVTIIALTGDTKESNPERFLAAGMDDYLTKPVNLDSLSEALYKWLPKAEAHQVLDESVLHDIQELNDEEGPDLLSVLLEMYKEETPFKIAKLKQFIQAGDLDEIALLAHNLKSSSLSLGIDRFSRLLSRIETAAKDGLLEPILAETDSLLPLYEEACRELEAYLK
ncbi:ATP-binding protein [Paenibacillus faecalis]|uniref:ATP-binding protein n=1 Tax=Paenibacillus faecalis TaxID=2079532 RepID=UPI001F4546F5|nr:ATP-binding protein [Paenibacillus faecalis]